MLTSRNFIILLILIGSATFLVYLPALENGFVNWDDPGYVIENQYIRSITPQNLSWMVFDYHFFNWHPLTWLSLAVDYSLWGLNPKGYHLTNLVLHAINTMLAVVLARMLFILATGKPTQALQFSILVGLLFGLHPIHVESVAWVSERKDLLYCLFYLSSIIFYLQYQSGRYRLNYILCLLMFILSLLSKPMAISLPLVLVVLDYYPLGKLKFNGSSIFKSIWNKLPLFALALILAVVTFVVQNKSGAMESMQIVSWGERLLLAQRTLLFYLYKTFVPFNYIYFYPIPTNITLLNPLFSIPLAANALLVYACYRLRNKMPFITSSALIYFVTLLPVLGVIQVGGQAAADRYMYLTLLVPIILTVSGIMYLKECILTGTRGKIILVGALVVIVSTLLYLTLVQIHVWKDTTTLVNHAIKHSQDNNHAYTKRAKDYFQRGMYHEAIDDINKAIEISSSNPYRATATKDWYFAFRGASHLKLAMYDNAIYDLSMAIAGNGTRSGYFLKRATAYEATGQPRLALMDYLRSFELAPNNPEVHNKAALIQYELGMHVKAIEHLSTAIRLKPEEGAFYFNRALNYNKLGDKDMVGRDLKKAAELGVQRAREILANQDAKNEK